MAVVVARMVASLEAETSQFHARMTAAEQQLGRWTSGATSARRGTMMLQSGLQQMAFSFGSLPPAIGRVSTALSSLFLGNPITLAILGVTAAIAALGAAFEKAAKQAAEFEEENRRVRDFQQQHLQMLAGLASVKLTPAEELAGLRAQRLAALAAIPGLQRATEAPFALPMGPAHAAAVEVATTAAKRLAVLTGEIGEFDRAIADLSLRIRDTARQTDLANRIFVANEIALERGGVFRALPISFTAPAFGTSAVTPPGGPATFANIRKNVPRFVPGEKTPSPGLPPEFFVMSALAAIQGSQGGPGAFFGAAAAPVGMLNPLAGLITGGVGAVFSLFDKSEERRHRELVDAVEKLGQEVGLDRVTVVFTGPDGHQIRRTLAELEEGDAVERVPGPVGATG